MTVPNTFRQSRETSLVNYNYTDIANGVGFSTFYGCYDSSGNYNLIPINEDSHMTGGGNLNTGTTYLFKTSAFNLPRRVRGNLYLHTEDLCSSDGVYSFTVQVKILRDSSYIDISSTISTSWDETNSSNWREYLTTIPLTETNIKLGDVLVLEIIRTNRSGTYFNNPSDGRRFAAYVPFEINK